MDAVTIEAELARLEAAYLAYAAPLAWALAESGVEPSSENLAWMARNREQVARLRSILEDGTWG